MVKRIYKMGINVTLSMISSKWKPLILCHLGFAPLRNGQLKNRIHGISQKVLTQQLRELEHDGIIARTEYDELPRRVVYHLTDEGNSLRDLLVEMSVWGENRAEEMRQAGQDVKLLYPGPEVYDQPTLKLMQGNG